MSKTISMTLNSQNLSYKASLVAFYSAILFVMAMRSPELISMVISNPTDALKVFVIVVALPSFIFLPPKTGSLLIRRLGLICIIIATLKNDMDVKITENTMPKDDVSSFVAIVTGANAGIGLAVVSQLLQSNVTVIMACRSLDKCMKAKASISTPANEKQLIPMHLDLSDLASIREFTSYFSSSYSRLDVLVNNAGVFALPGTRTKQGFEESLGVMHVGHFALTQWLLPLLLRPVEGEERAARVVNVASQAHISGDFHASLLDGDGLADFTGAVTDNCGTTGPLGLVSCCPLYRCPITNGYGRAKLANVLHMHALQLHVDQRALSSKDISRRLVTASLHPGTVSTDIHPALKLTGLVLRSNAQAASVVMHALFSDKFVPGAYIDSQKRAVDLQDYRTKHLARHVAAYPSVGQLPYAKTPVMSFFSLDEYFWKRVGHSGLAMDELATRLWDVSEKIVATWEKNKSVVFA